MKIKQNKKLNYFIISLLSTHEDLIPFEEIIEDNNIDKNQSVLQKEEIITLPEEKRIYNFPINFNDDYLQNIFKNIDNRGKDILKSRYGFNINKLRTLDEIGKNQNISRERVRQIISQTLRNLFINNYQDAGQIVYFVKEKIDKYQVVSMESLLEEIFIIDKKDRNSAIKFLLAILSVIKNIKKFNLSDEIFLIDINKKEKILEDIDIIKLLIKKIESNISDSIKNKKKIYFGRSKKR